MSESTEVTWDLVKPQMDILTAAQEGTRKVVGMTTTAAKKWLESRKVECRVIEEGKTYDSQKREDRVNLTTKGDVVTGAAVG